MNNFDRVNFDNRLLFESVRYDEVEPYEVLKEVFGDWVPGDVIGDTSVELEPIGDDIWVPAIDYSMYWPIPANDNDSFDVFQDGIKRIREMMMNVHLIGDANSQRHLIQLLYADVITTLETYLVQVYLKKVFESDETIINVLNNHNDLKAKFNSIDLTDLMKGDAKAIIEQRCDDLNKHIQNLSWHNPVAVSNRFDKVDIKIDLAKTGLKELIQNRHDIIHRSGKSIEGRPFGGVVAQISQQIMISPAPSDRYTRGFLTGRPRVFSLFIALTYAITSPT
ncbi:hypothetical protein [Aeromonas salmonicida]|nr:hypothetical protein [Aeromonas salmonicida]